MPPLRQLTVLFVACALASCSACRSTNVCDTMRATEYILDPWPDGLVCGELATVWVVSAASPEEKAQVEAGVSEVEGVLDGTDGLPVLRYEEDTSPMIPVRFTGSGTLYWGQGTIADGITITRTDTPGGGGPGEALILHETVQVIGFREKNNVGTPYPALVDCAIEVVAQKPLNETLCSHEVQSIYAAFSLRDGLDVDLDRELISVLLIEPSDTVIAIGEEPQFVPAVDEEPVPTSGVTWLLTDPDGSLEVVRDHRMMFIVRGVGEGRALLDATLAPTTAAQWPWPVAETASIEVVSGPPPPVEIDSVAVVPTEFELDQGQPFVIMLAAAFDADGDSIPGVEFDWTSSDPDVAEVQPLPGETNRARVTGCWLDSTRTATITATASGSSESAAAVATVTDVACRLD